MAGFLVLPLHPEWYFFGRSLYPRPFVGGYSDRMREPHFGHHVAAGAQDAAVQEPGFSPEISFNPRRRLQHLQRPTPSHLRPDAPRASRCRDDHVADRSRSGLTIPEPPTLSARGTAT